MKRLIPVAVLLCAAGYLTATGVLAQNKPAAGGPLSGAVDIHVHAYPDSQGRSIDALEAVRQAKAAGLRAIVFKAHYDNTAPYAYIIRKVVPDIEVFGGIALNHSMGGVNVAAVERLAEAVVSGEVGEIIEAEVKRELQEHAVPFYETGRAERIPGFDQAPDFLVPSAKAPQAVIEAKLAEDDGTARDKVTRVQHLRELADKGRGFEVIACIDGRGFSIRREDMKKLIIATKGKVFTMSTLYRLVEATVLNRLRAGR